MESADLLGRAAKALLDSGRIDLAREVVMVALERAPEHGNCHSVMAGVLEGLGAFDAALPHWRDAARLMPDSPKQRFNLALALLLRGDYRAGFDVFEARQEMTDWTPMAARDGIAGQRARRLAAGHDVAGKRVVVFTEQGLGDGVMFGRYLPMLAARGAQVTLICAPALRPVLERIGGAEKILSPPPDLPAGKVNLAAMTFDAFAPLMSLPGIFATRLDGVPNAPYLPRDATAIAAWRAGYAAAGRPGHRKVGLVFQANPASGSYGDRSMAVADVLALTDLPGIDIVNLQLGPAGRELAARAPRVIDALAAPVPLDAFAAAVAATDLLISVDTMAVHVAGAQGHPVWVAVPRAPHWYWGLGNARSAWYPNTRIFRQETWRDWPDVTARIGAALQKSG